MTAYDNYNPYGFTRPEIVDHDDDYAHAGDDARDAAEYEARA